MARADVSHPDLQLDEDLDRQRRRWRMQRIGWGVLALFVLAGALGLFGGVGVLNETVVRSPDGALAVTYPRFTRYLAPTELSVRVDAAAAAGDTLRVAVSRAYLDQWEMYGISPQPRSERIDGDRMVFEFEVSGPGIEVGFHGRPHRIGRMRGTVRVEGQPPLAFTTWAWP